jgi:hypothetical protein
MRQLALRWPEKAEESILDYSVDLGDELATGDTVTHIAASIKPAGELTIGGRSVGEQLYANGSLVTVWLQGGVAGRTYLVRLVVTCSNSKVFDILTELRVANTLGVSPATVPVTNDFSTAQEWSP